MFASRFTKGLDPQEARELQFVDGKRMRVVLVGPPVHRRQLRAKLPDGVVVVAEAATLSAARTLPIAADGWLVAAELPETEVLVESLTAREAEVLALVADGLSNKAVATRLGLSDETVKFHLSSIFAKLHASNRTDAVRQALKRGLIPL